MLKTLFEVLREHVKLMKLKGPKRTGDVKSVCESATQVWSGELDDWTQTARRCLQFEFR